MSDITNDAVMNDAENKSGSRPYQKPRLLHSDAPDQAVPGFDFTRSDFEDLIDNFTPIDDIPVLLGVSKADLDRFCFEVYNQKFKQAYDSLLLRAQLYYRKAMFMLSKSGNPTAIKVASEFYVGLGSMDKTENQVIFVSSVPQNAKSDVEILQEKQKQAEQDNFKNSVDKANELFAKKNPNKEV